MWIKLTSHHTNWSKEGNADKDVDLYVRTETIVAIRELIATDDDRNNTLLFIAHSSADGWLEFGVLEKSDEIRARCA